MSENTQNQNPEAGAVPLNDDRHVRFCPPGALSPSGFFRNRLAVVGLSILVAMFPVLLRRRPCQPLRLGTSSSTYTQMSKEFVGVTRNDRMRFVVADGQNFWLHRPEQGTGGRQERAIREFNYKDS